ncbi:hypothetical protein BIWAKO_00445 [Bosea sp. BIWAKO-01]|nr:hypothetical protein BIWAKO_00445 [Bosea sp. BIWAKO-01]
MCHGRSPKNATRLRSLRRQVFSAVYSRTWEFSSSALCSNATLGPRDARAGGSKQNAGPASGNRGADTVRILARRTVSPWSRQAILHREGSHVWIRHYSAARFLSASLGKFSSARRQEH